MKTLKLVMKSKVLDGRTQPAAGVKLLSSFSLLYLSLLNMQHKKTNNKEKYGMTTWRLCMCHPSSCKSWAFTFLFSCLSSMFLLFSITTLAAACLRFTNRKHY